MTEIDKSLISDKAEPVSDTAHRVARALISSLPLGGALTEIFNALIEPPMERRRQAWMEQVSDAVNKIAKLTPVTVEQISSNDQFIDALIRASSAALRTHKEKKLIWLKNSIVNSAVKEFGVDEKEGVFIRIIDDLSVWHIELLLFYNAPHEYIKERSQEGEKSAGMIYYIKQAFPALNDEDYIKMIWSELRTKGLITLESARELRFKRPQKEGDPLELASCTSSVGYDLVMFLSDPETEHCPIKKNSNNDIIRPW